MHTSVGPYRFTTSAPVSARARAASSAGSASPPQKSRRSVRHSASAGWSTTTRSTDGTSWSTVIPSRRTASSSSPASRCAPGGAMTSVAPASSGAQNSHTDASKPMGVFCSRRSAGARGKARSIQAIWLASARCGTPTPFGSPVEPEV